MIVPETPVPYTHYTHVCTMWWPQCEHWQTGCMAQWSHGHMASVSGVRQAAGRLHKVFKNELYFEKFPIFRETLLRGYGVTEYTHTLHSTLRLVGNQQYMKYTHMCTMFFSIISVKVVGLQTCEDQ